MVEPIFFTTADEFRAWLAEHHETAVEVLVGYYKKSSGKQGLSWAESVDHALCYGWIDGIRRSLDDERYYNRFTPRKKTSIWSAINIKRVEELTALGLMRPAGLAAFAARSESRTNRYSFEQQEPIELDSEFTALFQADDAAWTFFHAQPPGYRKVALWWVISAKREDTRRKRLAILIADSANGKRISQQA